MVTPQGFNALLKIVEEPPEHVKFVFATTEPEKVIGTIRSRTHHYPFRLVPPARLQSYMEELCVKEGVAVAPGVLSFVVRAGGGSVRDSLSVLDQLIAGLGPRGAHLRVGRGAARLHRRRAARRGRRRLRRAGRRGRLPHHRQGRRDRPRPAPLRRGPPRAAARPHRRGGRDRRCGLGPAARARGPARADAPPGRRVRAGALVARGRRRQRRAHRDDGRHRAAAPARAHRGAHPAPGRGGGGGVRRPPGPPRAAARRGWGAQRGCVAGRGGRASRPGRAAPRSAGVEPEVHGSASGVTSTRRGAGRGANPEVHGPASGVTSTRRGPDWVEPQVHGSASDGTSTPEGPAGGRTARCTVRRAVSPRPRRWPSPRVPGASTPTP